MGDYTVRIEFDDGLYTYLFPQVYEVKDNLEGMKGKVHHGTRADGCIVIPGGKKSQKITIDGNLFDADGYEDLTTLMNIMRTQVTTDPATLTMKHLQPPSTWVDDWSYTVRRVDEISFGPSMRIGVQPYSVSFIVTSY